VRDGKIRRERVEQSRQRLASSDWQRETIQLRSSSSAHVKIIDSVIFLSVPYDALEGISVGFGLIMFAQLSR
jgi:hypothetical protein